MGLRKQLSSLRLEIKIKVISMLLIERNIRLDEITKLKREDRCLRNYPQSMPKDTEK
jgi:hypothetical protein